MRSFDGLSEADFDAYEERKWSSNRFNLERMRAREKLEALVANALSADWIARARLRLRCSQDHPCVFNHRQVDAQWVYYARVEEDVRRLATILDREHPLHRQIEDPAEHHHHAILGVAAHHRGLDVGFALHRNAWVDARNLAARLQEPYEATLFAERLAALPEDTQLEHGGVAQPIREVEPDAVRAAARAFAPEGEAAWFRFGIRVPREEAVARGADLVPAVHARLRALASLYEYAAWRPDNDHLRLHVEIRTQKQVAKAQTGAQSSAIESGVDVRVTAGLFAGREGKVLELDGKGGAKVLVGAVPIKVRVGELQRQR